MNKFQSYSRHLTHSMALLLCVLATGCERDPILGFDGGIAPAPTPDTTRPTVTLTVPAAGATNVATNTAISATFSEDMAPATITAAGTFTVTGPGATAVAGTVAYAVGSRTATFTPAAVLPFATLFTATITTAATDLAGNALAGNQPPPAPAASNYVWTFTTGASGDTTPPTVTIVNPAAGATAVCLQQSVNATFDEAMDPATITTATFTLQVTGPPLGPVLGGVVSYDAPSRVATLDPTSDLLANTQYTATVTTGARDLAGNALAVNQVWIFTSGAAACSAPPPIVNLGNAAQFGNLGGTAGTTNTGLLTVVNGDLGSTATATSAVTGFHDAADTYTETPANSGSVNGTMYTCTNSTTGPTSAAPNPVYCSVATQARNDAQTAYNDLAGLPSGGCAIPCAANLGGVTLFPGVYTAPSGSFQIIGGDLTLDAQGDANASWVFQMASTLTVGGPGAAFPQSVILINGAQAKNVFWQVGSSATINAAGGGTMVGTIIASAGISFSTVGNVTIVTLNGRAIGLNASVTFTNTVVNVPAP